MVRLGIVEAELKVRTSGHKALCIFTLLSSIDSVDYASSRLLLYDLILNGHEIEELSD